jgi:tRNA modification GTPase
MLPKEDTIAAISTPVGQGGIGIVRMSGPQVFEIIDKIFRPKRSGRPSGASSNMLLYGHIIDTDKEKEIDEVLVSLMRNPNSYTREDVVEINCHGGMISVKRVLETLLRHGARLAEPGEFTKRAFLNGRIGLTEAEAVLDLIHAKTNESMKMAVEQLRGGLAEQIDGIRSSLMEICALVEAYIDFPEDDINVKTNKQLVLQLETIKREIEQLSGSFQEARFFREGLSVAIVGRPNVGKSSLLNALLKRNRAIVTDFPGTTRDQIEEFININGLPVRITDTAGIRNSSEAVEKEGIRRSLDAINSSDYIIAMFDGSEPLTEEDFELLDKIADRNGILAINKSDLPSGISFSDIKKYRTTHLLISALTGDGLENLKSAVFNSNLKNWKEEREGVVVTNIRHKVALDRAALALEGAINSVDKQPLEIFAIDLREALDNIGEITGVVTSDDILNKIFSEFCIGK